MELLGSRQRIKNQPHHNPRRATVIRGPLGHGKGQNVQIRHQTHLPIRTYTTTVRRMMATAAEMAIITTWLFSLEMENAAKPTENHINNLRVTHLIDHIRIYVHIGDRHHYTAFGLLADF